MASSLIMRWYIYVGSIVDERASLMKRTSPKTEKNKEDTKNNQSWASAGIRDRVELHWKCLQKPVVTRGDSFWGCVALKLVVTTLLCLKLVINLWRFALQEKRYCKSDRYTQGRVSGRYKPGGNGSWRQSGGPAGEGQKWNY